MFVFLVIRLDGCDGSSWILIKEKAGRRRVFESEIERRSSETTRRSLIEGQRHEKKRFHLRLERFKDLHERAIGLGEKLNEMLVLLERPRTRRRTRESEEPRQSVLLVVIPSRGDGSLGLHETQGRCW